MDTPILSSRRSVLKGLGTLAALTATAAPSLAGQPDVSPALVTLAGTYAAAYRDMIEADEKLRVADRAFDDVVKAAQLRIPMWGRRGGMRGHFLTLEGSTSPEYVRDHIETHFASRAESARAARARQPELAKWLASPDDELAALGEVRPKAETALAEWTRLYDAAGLSALDDASQAAYTGFYAARNALFSHRPETMGDVRAVARMMWQAAEDTGRWYELPTRQFLAALCPELSADD